MSQQDIIDSLQDLLYKKLSEMGSNYIEYGGTEKGVSNAQTRIVMSFSVNEKNYKILLKEQ